MPKPVKLDLVGLDGNAFSLMGAFTRQALKEGWTKEEIQTVLEDAKSSDYNHLLNVLMKNTRTDVSLKIKEEFDGEFKTFSFTRGKEKIGTVFLRLKRGWNQLHITIEDKYQGKGYGVELISSVVDRVGYISIPDGRVVNKNFTKVVDKLNRSKYEVKRTQFDETIVYKKGEQPPEVYKDDLI